MEKALAIFRRDLRRILHNPVAALVAAGICIVPCLYAWINLLANWDPYANTGDITVAVANVDQAMDLDDIGSICVGDMMVEALGENDSINWQFVGEEDAKAGVRAGTYYAAIVIPQDFTKNLTGILDGKTDKAHLAYYVNEKVNPIAPKVTDTVASTVQNEIDSKFVAKVGEVVSEKLSGLSDSVTAKSGDALGKGIDVLDDVHLTLVNANDKLGSLEEKLTSTQSSLSGAVDTIASFEGTGARVGDKLGGVLNDVDTTRTNANRLMTDLNAELGNGASSISSLSSQANYDVSAIAGDIASSQALLNSAIRALENDLADNDALTSKVMAALDLVVNIHPTDEGAEGMRLEIERELENELALLVQISDDQSAKLDELRALAEKLETAADEVAAISQSLDGRVQSATNALSEAQTGTVSATLLEVHSALDSFVSVGNDLESAARMVDPIVSQTVALTRQFADALSGTNEALEGTRSSLSSLADTVGALSEELSVIRTSDAWTTLKGLVSTNPESVHEFLSSPVEVNEIALYPVKNYASGVAPFFTSLALWVGGIALIAIFKLEVDEDEVGPIKPWQAYLGRWMLLVCLGALQAIACCTGNLIIGIQCAHPWAYYLSAIVASFAFVNVIFSLSTAFKHLGKALAFTLIILQVPGSAGTYPIEMMPPFFQAIGPWLPFTYSNNAMREAIAGFYGTNLLFNLAMLLLFVVPSILVGITARSHLVNINALFDRRLRETDHLMVIEPIAIDDNRYRLATVVKALHNPAEYREALEARSAAFEKAYPTLVRRGIAALMLLPLALFGLMLVLDAQLPTVACLIVALVAIYVFLVVVEYFHDRILHKRALTELSQEELMQVLNRTLQDEPLAYVPIDAILERENARTDRLREILPVTHLPHMATGAHHDSWDGDDEL